MHVECRGSKCNFNVEKMLQDITQEAQLLLGDRAMRKHATDS